MEDEENRDPEDGSKSDQDPDDEKKQDRDPGTDSPDEKGADQKTPGDNEEKKDSESTSPDSRDPSGQDRDPGGEKSGQDSPSGRNKKDSPNGKKKDRGVDPPDRDGKGDGKNRRNADRDPGNRDAGGRRQNRRLPRLKSAEELEGDWKETSRRMEAEILASGKEASDERGSLDRILSISNRRRTDYREFLRKFAILREVTTIDPDSFDYGFYHYGLEMYGNMPLIEENEYREMNNLRTLVIAIDTSASCQDVLVQRFLNETASVLRSIGQFFATSSVYIVECDEHVQQEILLHGPDDLEKYASAFHVKGGFGTDFRPVFAWVEEKRRTGEIGDMQALMYFTDGMGVYPEKPTDYDTAFVFFNDEEMDDTKVPDWAVRLYIDGEKIKARTHRYGDGT